MSLFTGFNQVPDAAAQEQKNAPVVSESFVVHVQSPDCNCVVVATGDERSGLRRVFPHNRCNKSWRDNPGPAHELKLHEMAQIAKRRMLQLIDLMRSRHA
jgi:hypothetical protein